MLPYHRGDSGQRKRKRSPIEITDTALQSHAARDFTDQSSNPNQVLGFNGSGVSGMWAGNLLSNVGGNWWDAPAAMAPFQPCAQYQPAAALMNPCMDIDNMVNHSMSSEQAMQPPTYSIPSQQLVPLTSTYPMAALEPPQTFIATPLTHQYSYPVFENFVSCQQAAVPELQLPAGSSQIAIDPNETVCFGVVSPFQMLIKSQRSQVQVL